MKKYLLPLALALCLLLAACGNQDPTDNGGAGNDSQAGTNQPDQPAKPDEPGLPEDPGPIGLGALTVEVVLDWDAADSLLSRLEDLSVLLDKALERGGYDAEAITVTVSTAGGTTADALAAGGVDVALLPAEDYVACEDSAAAILMTGEEVPAAVAAVTEAKPELDEAFRAALAAALTDGADGESFLSVCYPGAAYVPYDSAALQPVRDQLAEEESGIQ